MAQQEPIRKRTGPPGPTGPVTEIPDKLYFRIGEVARLCEVPTYVLRFWESEFPQLKPNKGGSGQRLYRRRDVEMALKVKHLLYDEGYTIAGARQAFKTELRTAKDPQAAPITSASSSAVDTSHLIALQKELRELHALLSRPAANRPAVQQIRPSRPVAVPRPAPMQFPKPLTMKPKPKPEPNLFDLFPEDEPA